MTMDVMQSRSRQVAVATLFAMLCAAAPFSARGQSAGTVQPGAPGEPSRQIDAARMEAAASPRHTAADVRFVQGMIPHHAQALEMTALVPERSSSQALQLLAERIEVTQGDEIAWMQRWLQDRGEALPEAHAHHGGHLMPGMLTPAQMAQLKAATGTAFDRLFLELMISHHEGALVMVSALFAASGAAQEPQIYRFASDVEVDQRAEIKRMRAMLGTPPAPAPPTSDTHHH